MTENSSHRGRKVEDQRSATHDVKHIIRVVGTDGMLYDISMTEAQMKETRRLARYSGYRKHTFHDLIVALLDEGALTSFAPVEREAAL